MYKFTLVFSNLNILRWRISSQIHIADIQMYNISLINKYGQTMQSNKAKNKRDRKKYESVIVIISLDNNL